MYNEQSIVVGCDDPVTLSAILNCINTLSVPVSVISSSRVTDLLGIVQSITPDLILLCFRSNQLVLNDLDTFLKRPEIPVVCLTHSPEGDQLRWRPGSIVFTYPTDSLNVSHHLCDRIASVLLLKSAGIKHADAISSASYVRSVPPPTDESRNLSRYVMELDQKVEILNKVRERIAGLYPHVNDPTRSELMSIVNSIKVSSRDSNLWEDFKVYFETTNPDFLFRLSLKHPDLSPKDVKYCCYLTMNMTNDDIRRLLGINQESVRTHKYRLKRKMSLSRNEDLRGYLRSIGQREAQLA